MCPDEWIEALRVHIESLNSNLEKQIEASAIDRESIRLHSEQLRKDGENIRQLAKIAQAQSESIGQLAKIAERHGARLDTIDGGV